MYSGTTFRTKSGRVMGVHQKIDRVAYRHLKRHLSLMVDFPTIRQILHFEGLNGPDGVKRKSPAVDEPWHYVDPKNESDTTLLEMIQDHITNLTEALRTGNDIRAAYEAAWMAHAVTDGLTPAHHYPLEEKLEQLRGGQGLETRVTAKEKIILPGKTRREQLRNNWEFWGAKGVMTTHFAFELGVATTIAPHKLDNVRITEEDILRLQHEGFAVLFNEAIQEIDRMQMYEEFSRLGWTRHLAKETRDVLLPRIIRVVCLGWYQAVRQASEQSAR